MTQHYGSLTEPRGWSNSIFHFASSATVIKDTNTKRMPISRETCQPKQIFSARILNTLESHMTEAWNLYNHLWSMDAMPGEGGQALYCFISYYCVSCFSSVAPARPGWVCTLGDFVRRRGLFPADLPPDLSACSCCASCSFRMTSHAGSHIASNSPRIPAAVYAYGQRWRYWFRFSKSHICSRFKCVLYSAYYTCMKDLGRRHHFLPELQLR